MTKEKTTFTDADDASLDLALSGEASKVPDIPDWQGDDRTAQDHLEAKGFVCTRAWEWIKPYKGYVLTPKDYSAIHYLALEWDWGGLSPNCDSQAPDKLTYVQPKLTEAEQYILGWLSEENAECIKMAVGKTLRFGFRTPGRLDTDGEPDLAFTPENELHTELGDTLAAIELGFRYGVFERERIYAARDAKIIKVLSEKDNLGRPLAPPLPPLPIRGPDGATWEPAEYPHVRREVVIEDYKDGNGGVNIHFVKVNVRPHPNSIKKIPLRERIVNWWSKRRPKDDGLDELFEDMKKIK